MASIKLTLEVDRDSGALLNVLDQEGEPALMAEKKERRKWHMHDIHISAGNTADCPNGYYAVTINNCHYCFPY